jgi:hypothetical protein
METPALLIEESIKISELVPQSRLYQSVEVAADLVDYSSLMVVTDGSSMH